MVLSPLRLMVRAAVMSLVKLAMSPAPFGMMLPAQLLDVGQVPAALLVHVPVAANTEAEHARWTAVSRVARRMEEDVRAVFIGLELRGGDGCVGTGEVALMAFPDPDCSDSKQLAGKDDHFLSFTLFNSIDHVERSARMAR